MAVNNVIKMLTRYPQLTSRPNDSANPLRSVLALCLYADYHGDEYWTFLDIMQAENVKYFTERLDRLQAKWNCTDIDLANRIGISRQLIYLMRSGSQKPSKKSLRLLDAAERAAGLHAPESAAPGVPTAGPGPSPAFQHPEATDEKPSNERKSTSKTVPTPEYALASVLHRLDAVEKTLSELVKLMMKGKR